MELVYFILSGAGIVVWFFFRQFLTDQKQLRNDFTTYKNDVGESLGKLRGRVDLLEMDIKSEIKTFKQVSEMQYNQIHSDISEIKELLKKLNK
jgi:hypothetical protein